MAWNSTDPVRLLVGDELGELMVFAPGETIEAQPPRIPCRPVAMEWNPADGRIAIAGSDGLVRIVTPDFQIETLAVHRGAVLSVTWSADGGRLASGGQDGTVAIWNPGARSDTFFRRKFLDPLTSLAVSNDGKRVAAGTAAGTIVSGDPPWQGEIPGGAVSSLAWSPDATQLAAGTGDDRVLVFEPGKAGIPTGETTANPDEIPVPRVRWSPDGKSIAAASHSGTVRLIELPGAVPRTLGKLPDLALGLAWNPGGNQIAASSTRGEIFIWDNLSEAPRRLDTANSHFESIGGLAWSPDGTRLASCGNDGTVRLWNPAAAGKPVAVSTPVDSQLEEVVYSEDGKLLATCGSDGFLRLWQADDLAPYAAVHAHDGHAGTVVWRGNRLISASEDASVSVLSLDENQWRSRARKIAGTAVSQPKPSTP
jgi:WD40 repeat protein